jgi:PAS domain S-box-containing protein
MIFSSTIFFIFLVALIEISVASVIGLGSRERAAKAFVFFIGVHILWIISHGFFHGIDPNVAISTVGLFKFFHITTGQQIATFFVQLNFFLGGVIASLFYYFTLTFPKNDKPRDFVLPTIVFINTVMFFACFYFGNVVNNAQYIGNIFGGENQGWKWNYGNMRYLFDIIFDGFFILGLYTLYKKSKITSDTLEKTRLRFMLWGLVTSILPSSIVNVILPNLGNFNYDWLGPISSLLWMSVISYSIFKYRQLNTRAVLSEILIFVLGIILFINIFVSNFLGKREGETVGSLVKTGVFLFFIMFGKLLVTNILKEQERIKMMGQLNFQLKVLNSNLSGMILNRTQELAEAKTHSETLLENLTIGIVEYDEKFVVLRLNQAAEQMLGIDRKNVVGKTIQPKDNETKSLVSLCSIMFPGLSEETKKLKPSEDFEQNIAKNEVVINDPIHREIQVLTIPISTTYATETPRFVKLLRDVTQENLIDRSKTEFLTISAHQLRTPLAGSKWSMFSILDKDLGEIPPEQEHLVKTAYSANNSLIDIVNNLLNITQIEESLGYRKEPCNILDTIKEAVRSSLVLLQDKKLTISIRKTIATVPISNFDRIKIIIAIKSIFGNAIDYTPDGGKIDITLSKEGDFFAISIADTGIGIPDNEIRNVSKRFYRTPEAIKMVPNRSGLGIYVAKQIVEKHGGTLTINSEVGKGTTVMIRLPISTKV